MFKKNALLKKLALLYIWRLQQKRKRFSNIQYLYRSFQLKIERTLDVREFLVGNMRVYHGCFQIFMTE